MAILRFCALLILAAVPAFGQQAATKKPNELLAGKLIYVAPMPDNIDQWVIDFLRRWGKYKVTSNPEGVDLVLKAVNPDKDTEWEMRGGVPSPKGRGEGSRRLSPGGGVKNFR